MGAEVSGPRPTLLFLHLSLSKVFAKKNWASEGTRHHLSIKSTFIPTSWGKVWARAKNSFTVVEISRDKKRFAEGSWIYWDITLSPVPRPRLCTKFGFQLHIWINERDWPGLYIFWRTRPLRSLRTALGLRRLMSVSQTKEQSGFVRQSIACNGLIHPKAFQAVNTCITGSVLLPMAPVSNCKVAFFVYNRGVSEATTASSSQRVHQEDKPHAT